MKKVKAMKRLGMVAILALLFVALFCICVSAETYNGECGVDGDNLTWTLDTETGELVISGEGAMESNAYRWNAYSQSIKKVTLKDGVTSIGDSAFSGFYNLTEINISESVTSIGRLAFRFCSSLTEINIPESVTSVATNAFLGCYNVSSITVSEKNPVYHSAGNCLIETASKTLVVGCKASVIPADGSVTSIGDSAFSSCRNLIEIHIPESVTSVAANAFLGCYTLSSITVSEKNPVYHSAGNCLIETASKTLVVGCKASVIPADGSVTSIGTDAFNSCTNLTEINIPSSVTSIGAYAFSYCSLTEINIPESVTNVSATAFYRCDNLSSITVSEQNPVYHSAGNCLIETASKTLVVGCQASVIPDDGSVTSIGDSAFYGCTKLTEINIPDGVTSIGFNAFRDCNLTEINIPSSVTSIGEFAFRNCKMLTEIDISEGVTSIGAYAFNSCTNLTEIDISESVTSIGAYAFTNCTNLTEIDIPESVTSIGDCAFYYCTSLTKITILSKAVTIQGKNAIPNTATIYGYANSTAQSYATQFGKTFVVLTAYGDCGAAGDELIWILTADGELIIGGDGAMVNYASYSSTPWYSYRNSIKKVTIESGVKNVGRLAFYGCSSLAEIMILSESANIFDAAETIADGATIYGYAGSMAEAYATKYDRTFVDIFLNSGSCGVNGSNLTWGMTNDGELIIRGEGEMANYMYYSNIPWNSYRQSIKKVTIKEGVTSIGERAFPSCSNLVEITIPNSMKSIGAQAFEHNRGLVSVTIPNGVTSIGNDAFFGCQNLGKITILSKTVNIFNQYTIPATTTIYGYIGSTAESYAAKNGQKFVNVLNDSGICGVDGNNLTWSLTSLGELVIRGNGAMANYTSFSNGPWFSWHESIKKVTIEEGVTSIGDHAFYGCSGITEITLPNGVTNIGNSAFEGCSKLVEVTMPRDITNIGNAAFKGCSALAEITIPSNVSVIGDSAFQGCSDLLEVAIPEGVISIGNGAFEGCLNLSQIVILSKTVTIFDSANTITDTATINGYVGSTAEAYATKYGRNFVNAVRDSGACGINGNHLTWELTYHGDLIISGEGAMANYTSFSNIPWYSYRESIQKVIMKEGVTSIGENAFYNCSNLMDITIPNGVTSIGGFAFSRCSSLAAISIPKSMTSIGSYAFSDCSNISSITVSEQNPVYHSAGNCLIETASKTLVVGCKASIIPAGGSVTSIGNYAFYNNREIGSIVIPSAVQNIGDYAFYGCSNLANVSIADGVKIIGEDAFGGCSSLAEITIPESVTTIERSAFVYCSNLGKITIWSPTVSIYDAEQTIPDAAVIRGHVDSTSESYAMKYGRIFVNVFRYSGICGADGSNLTWGITDDGELIISGNGAMANYANTVSPWDSYRESIEVVIIKNGVTSVGDHAFRGWYNFTEINIPSSVTSIGDSAFSGCTKLTEINIPSSVTSIGDSAFGNCSSLIEIDIPESVTSIGAKAFQSCYNLSSITVSEKNPVYHSAGNCLIETASKTIVVGCQASVIPSDGSVTSIGDSAFSGCTKLTEIHIPESVTNVSATVFYGCNNLSSITVSEQNPVYHSAGNCLIETASKTLIRGCNTSMIPTDGSVTSIGDYAFSYSISLTEINIPDSVTSIGDYAFDHCVTLTEIAIPDGVTSIGDYAFASCTSLTEVVIPDSITSIGAGVFSYCQGFTEFIIPDSVTSIGYAAFAGCINLTEITIPNSVESLGRFAFSGCSLLSEVTIPKSVTSIDYNAFNLCSSLTAIKILSKTATIMYSDTTIPSTAVIYAHSGSTAEAYANDYGRTFIATHDYASGWFYDSNSHWLACADCEMTKSEAEHDYTNKCDNTCNTCTYERVISHSYNAEWSNDQTSHWIECADCGTKKDKSEHVYSEKCDVSCNICSYERVVSHSYKSEWSSTEEYHYYECADCGIKKDETPHSYTNLGDVTCDICSYERTLILPDADFISYQLTKGKEGRFSVRVLAGLNSLEYNNFGYKVTITTKDADGNDVIKTFWGSTGKAYSSVYGGTTKYSIKEYFGYEYAGLVTITNLAIDSSYTELEICPFVTTRDGEVKYGKSATLLYTGTLDENEFPALELVTE